MLGWQEILENKVEFKIFYGGEVGDLVLDKCSQ